jgi:hypothetical protein
MRTNATEGRRFVNPKKSPGAGCRISGPHVYAVAFGLFLGLAIVKFGNPVILDHKTAPPENFAQVWSYSWPVQWAYWLFIPLALIGFGMVIHLRPRWSGSRWLCLLPLVWFAWQLVSATRTVDAQLTVLTLRHFAGCLACYFLGALALGRPGALRWLLIGVLAAFTFCLVRAVNQRIFEFPAEHQALLEGERCGWTNFPPDLVLELKRSGTIISTNGMEVANPVIVGKFAQGRVMGTLVYPNALAGVVLLLFPVSLALAFNSTRQLRAVTRATVIALTLFLGCAALFWTGSKLGWLVAMAIVGVWLFHFDWPRLWKIAALLVVVILGSGVFAVRFHNYFASGAKSVGARFDYWRAAVQNTQAHPLVGSGPGTFQRPYALLKSPEAEMARLTHNDYLQQFCDSGIPGGISYAAWIVLALAGAGRRVWPSGDAVRFAVFLGLLGWFVQGLGEFSLYVPALAWTAFTLLGWLVAAGGAPSDVKC